MVLLPILHVTRKNISQLYFYKNKKMEKFLTQNFKNIIASLLIVISLIILLEGDAKISNNLQNCLYGLIIACTTYLFK